LLGEPDLLDVIDDSEGWWRLVERGT
jgi:hypothetical protein